MHISDGFVNGLVSAIFFRTTGNETMFASLGTGRQALLLPLNLPDPSSGLRCDSYHPQLVPSWTKLCKQCCDERFIHNSRTQQHRTLDTSESIGNGCAPHRCRAPPGTCCSFPPGCGASTGSWATCASLRLESGSDLAPRGKTQHH